MADFNTYPSLQLQNPDMLGGYLKGMLGGQQLQLGQQQLAIGGQELQKGALSMEQLKLAMAMQQQRYGFMGGVLARQEARRQQQEASTGGPGDTGQGAPSMGTAGGAQGDQGQAIPTGGSSPAGAPMQPPSAYEQSVQMRNNGLRSLGADIPEPLMDAQEQQDWALLNDKYTPETEANIRENAIKTAQLRAKQPGSPLPMFQAIAGLEHPGAALAQPQNAALLAAYPAKARQFGFSPLDHSDATIRQVAAMAANEIERPLEMPLTAVPHQLRQGLYGSQFDPITGKEETAPKLPTLGMERAEVWNPATGQYDTRVTPMKTGGAERGGYGGGAPGGIGVARTALGLGGGAPQAGAARSAPPAAAGAGPAGPSGVSLGESKPNDEQTKLAGIAFRARQPMADMAAMEKDGPVLTEADRNLVISSLTRDNDGLLNLPANYLKQKLEGWAFTGKKAEYVAKLIPMVQAAAEQMPKTSLRGVDAPSLLSSLESMIPRSAGDVATAQENRRAAYHGLVLATGNAAHQLYPQTLGIDAQVARSGGKSVEIGGKTYVRYPNGKVTEITP